MKQARTFLFLLAVCLLPSCMETKPFTMEVLRPGYVNPGSKNERVLLINYSVVQPTTFGHTFSGLESTRRDTTYDFSYRVDTVGHLLLMNLAQKMRKEGFYESVEVAPDEWVNQQKDGPLAFLQTNGLNLAQRTALKKVSKATLWISMDRLLVESETKTKRVGVDYVTTRDVYVNTVWRVYDVPADSTLLVFQHRDTLFWDRMGVSPELPIRGLPEFHTTLAEISDYSAVELFRIFTPYWETIERYYYVNGNVQMQLAFDEVKAEKWDAAAVLWEQAYNTGTGLNPFRAAMNLALYFEKQGDPGSAWVWANRAEKAGKRAKVKPSAYEMKVLSGWIQSLTERVGEMNRLSPLIDGSIK